MRRKFNFKVHCPSETSDDVVLNFPPFSIIFRESGSNIVQFSLSNHMCCTVFLSGFLKYEMYEDTRHESLRFKQFFYRLVPIGYVRAAVFTQPPFFFVCRSIVMIKLDCFAVTAHKLFQTRTILNRSINQRAR